MTLEVKVSGLDELNASLEMLGRFGDAPLTRALKSIGQAVVGQTIERFENEVDPDGNKWKRRKVETNKTRGRKILHGETGQLKRVTYIAGKGFVKIGASVDYGVFHQFGTKKMPARPFLGINKDDYEEITEILTNQLRKHFGTNN